MASPTRPTPTPDEVLAREAAQKRTATFTAMTAAGLSALAVLVEQLIAGSGVPSFDRSDVVQTFAAQATGGEYPASFLKAVGEFKLEHSTETIAVAGLRGLAFVLMIPVILLLLRGARDRGGTLGRFLEPTLGAGLTILAVATFVVGFLEPAFYREARDNGFTPGAIRTAYENSEILVASFPVLVGSLMAGITISLAAIQSMRVGLLPRILGFMGVLVGLIFVIPIDSTGLVRAFWFAAIAWTISGRISTPPPAWATGRPDAPTPRQPPAPKAGKGAGGGKGSGAGGKKGAKGDDAGPKGGGKGDKPSLTK